MRVKVLIKQYNNYCILPKINYLKLSKHLIAPNLEVLATQPTMP